MKTPEEFVALRDNEVVVLLELQDTDMRYGEVSVFCSYAAVYTRLEQLLWQLLGGLRGNTSGIRKSPTKEGLNAYMLGFDAVKLMTVIRSRLGSSEEDIREQAVSLVELERLCLIYNRILQELPVPYYILAVRVRRMFEESDIAES